jgi:hypothetical protein
MSRRAWNRSRLSPRRKSSRTNSDRRNICPSPAFPDLFHNYWVPPNCGALGARLYVAPQPVPPVVGHTYITYQPLMPHEMLYPHHHTYYRYYDGGRGMTRAKVVYYRPPVRSAVGHVITHFRIPR